MTTTTTRDFGEIHLLASHVRCVAGGNGFLAWAAWETCFSATLFFAGISSDAEFRGCCCCEIVHNTKTRLWKRRAAIDWMLGETLIRNGLRRYGELWESCNELVFSEMLRVFGLYCVIVGTRFKGKLEQYVVSNKKFIVRLNCIAFSFCVLKRNY